MAKNDYSLGQVKMDSNPQDQNRRGGRGKIYIKEKPKDLKAALGQILSYSKKYLPAILIACLCAAGSVALTLAGPERLSRITDLITQGMSGGFIDTAQVLRISLGTIALYLLSLILTGAQSVTMVTITQRLAKKMRSDLSRKLNLIPQRIFDRTSHGDIISRVTNDVDTICDSLNASLGEIITGVITYAGCMFLMFRTNAIMAAVAIAASLFGFLAINVIVRTSQKHFRSNQKYLGAINGHIEEIYAGYPIVKAYGGEEKSLEEFQALSDALLQSNWKSQFLSGVMHPLMEFVGNFGYVAVCIAGAILAKNDTITFGVIVAFIVYVKMFTQPLGQMAQSVSGLQSAAAAAERVFAFFAEEEIEDESDKEKRLTVTRGAVDFSHVRFGYDLDKEIIHDFSVSIKPGQKVAIVGPTGAGKTTLVNLLMRFYEVNGGQISIDGISTGDVTRENVHDQFCMVLQDAWLFEGTVRDNIVFNMEDVTDERVEEVCKSIGLHRFIRMLPDGYDTVLSDSSNLSAGQRQLLTIARAMLKDAPLLILDEATSSVDTRTEKMVQDAMDKLTEGRTSFTIAHRLSTIRDADIILVLKDGDVVETGTHEQLLALGGFYAELWQSQFVKAQTI